LISPFSVGNNQVFLTDVQRRGAGGELEPIKISGLSTKYFEVRALVSGASTLSEVTTSLHSDIVAPVDDINTYDIVEPSSNFVWTPYKATEVPSETDPIWTNSYYSDGLITEDLYLTITGE